MLGYTRAKWSHGCVYVFFDERKHFIMASDDGVVMKAAVQCQQLGHFMNKLIALMLSNWRNMLFWSIDHSKYSLFFTRPFG